MTVERGCIIDLTHSGSLTSSIYEVLEWPGLSSSLAGKGSAVISGPPTYQVTGSIDSPFLHTGCTHSTT